MRVYHLASVTLFATLFAHLQAGDASDSQGDNVFPDISFDEDGWVLSPSKSVMMVNATTLLIESDGSTYSKAQVRPCRFTLAKLLPLCLMLHAPRPYSTLHTPYSTPSQFDVNVTDALAATLQQQDLYFVGDVNLRGFAPGSGSFQVRGGSPRNPDYPRPRTYLSHRHCSPPPCITPTTTAATSRPSSRCTWMASPSTCSTC